MRINVKKLFMLSLMLLLIGCQPYVYDCVINNHSLRTEIRANHSEMSDAEFEYMWAQTQDMYLRAYYKNGICDSAVVE